MPSQFGDMLLNRRRQMGLSIQQVANTIKIRPQIIEFFEKGDFSSMPPRGYAQGMISSYARFLGLNPRTVVGAYFDELDRYERETSRSGGHFQDAAGFVSARSENPTGRFMALDGGSRFAQRPPQAGYVSEANSGHEPIRVSRNPYRQRSLPRAGQGTPSSAYGRGGSSSAYGSGTQGPGRPSGRGAYRRARAHSHPEAPHMVNLVTEDPVLRAPCNLVARCRCMMHAWVVAGVTAMGPPVAVHHMARERGGRAELLCGVLARLRGAGVLPPSMAWTPVWSSACSPSCCC